MFYRGKNDISEVSGTDYLLRCRYCKKKCTKAGKQLNGKQKHYCKTCKRYSQEEYEYEACKPDINSWITRLNRECCGISSIARLLGISKTTVIKRIKELARKAVKPLVMMGKSYEVDELRTYIGHKRNECWICLAVEKQTGKVAEMAVGKRTKKTLRKVTDTLLLSEAKRINTDGLDIYKTLLPIEVHKVKSYNINRVERKNLDLRNSLKRLSRKTICYSKSKTMLDASVRLCLWG